MTLGRAARALALLAATALSSALIAAVAWGAEGDTRYVSRASAPANTPANGESSSPSVSADGRYVAFTSTADNLGDGDTDAQSDVFVRDTQTGETRYVSRASAPANTPGNDVSGDPSVSADGRYVAFASVADNIGDGDLHAGLDVFVRDTQTGATRLVSHASGPATGVSSSPSISADGRYVAFDSRADNIGDGDTDIQSDVFVRDTQTGTTRLVSRASAPANTAAAGNSFSPSISADGRYVAFQSAANNLGDGDTDTEFDVFVRDTQTGTTRLVSRASAPANTAAAGDSFSPSISADGRQIAFASRADNLGDGDTDIEFDVFVRDTQTGTTRLVSRASTPSDTAGNGDSLTPSISADGRYVAFNSRADNLGDGDTDTEFDVFVRDTQTGATIYLSRASAPAHTAANGRSFNPSVSADGRYVAFESNADNLGDGDTDIQSDVFVRDFLGAPGAESPPGAAPAPPGVTAPPQAPPDVIAPALTAESLTNARFRVGSEPTAVLAQLRRRTPRGTTFRYILSEQATVEIAIERAGPGVQLRRRGSRRLRCVAATRANRRRLARELLQTAAIRRLRGQARRRALRRATRRRACTSFKAVGALTRRDRGPGAVRTRFTGRIGRRSLSPARYRARLSATDAAGNRSTERRLTIRVVRR